MSSTDFERYNRVNGLGNVGSYQVSGKPWVSASVTVPALASGAPYHASFDYVTSYFSVYNPSSIDVRVGFSVLGTLGTPNANYIRVLSNQGYTGHFKVTDLYLISDGAETTADLSVALTSIPNAELPYNWSGSAGVG